MNYISTLALAAFDKASWWWSRQSRQSERKQSIICVVVLLLLLAIAGKIEGTAPSGMYY